MPFEKCEFQIGDLARIIDEAPYDCDAGWTRGMGKYCGKEATITGKVKHYKLDIDHGEWWWSTDVITKVAPELPDLDPVPPEALQILFG